MPYLIEQTLTPGGQDARATQVLGYIEADSAQDALRRLMREADFRKLHLNSTWLRREGMELRGDVLTEHLGQITWFSPIPEPWVAEYTARPDVEGRAQLDLLAPFAEYVFLTPEQEQVEEDDRSTLHALITWANYVRCEVKPARWEEWATPTVARLAHRLGLPEDRVQASLGRLNRTLAA